MTQALFDDSGNDEDEDQDQDLASVEVASSLSEAEAAEERAEKAAVILDEIGLILPDYKLGITDGSANFVDDMQERLEECRARRIPLACSEKQLEWLEGIQEKLGG